MVPVRHFEFKITTTVILPIYSRLFFSLVLATGIGNLSDYYFGGSYCIGEKNE
jgi:hypothetical protein